MATNTQPLPIAPASSQTEDKPCGDRPPHCPNSTVGQLRQQYGEHFAEGYEDTDPINSVLGRAGAATLGEYLEHHRPPSN